MPSLSDRPNVLLICTDHWAARYSGYAGHRSVLTPTIDQLARSGTWFEQAYSACPTCIPARRSLMTGMSARSHGDRVMRSGQPLPEAPTLAQCFRDAGYQAHAVGKLHVYPKRDRIGFDDVILHEEGRRPADDPAADDWELDLQQQGYAGQEFASGLANNEFITRTWHLPDHLHPTNWAARHMCRMIHRRDPRKPALWYLSFVGPHPPVWPLKTYMDQYLAAEIDEPAIGDWAHDPQQHPYLCRHRQSGFALQADSPSHAIQLARRAFYATITHIDHQIRVVIGTLREMGLLDNTIIAFTSDHGEMLGDHHLWTKAYMYEASAGVPLLISLPEGDDRLGRGRDRRLVELRDIMPTLLDLCGIDIPNTVEGLSLIRDRRRDWLYGEHYEGDLATRMVRDDRFKLIYYPAGNVRQLFDLEQDPREMRNLADDPNHQDTLQQLEQLLIRELYGEDLNWVRDGRLVGLEAPAFEPRGNRALSGQRGLRMI